MLKYALLAVKDFPKFVNGQFDILLNFVGELGGDANQMQSLAEEGVIQTFKTPLMA
jgi:hypothetical protein